MGPVIMEKEADRHATMAGEMSRGITELSTIVHDPPQKGGVKVV